MKRLVLVFVGGYWDTKTLHSDSPDLDEQLLTTACYEMSHHGAIGGECAGLSYEAQDFARRHDWGAAKEADWRGDHRYEVVERRETATEIIVTFRCVAVSQLV
ncbi:MAG: hypothetical protein ACYC0X_28590 [Pirellulaceae bacterium]